MSGLFAKTFKLEFPNGNAIEAVNRINRKAKEFDGSVLALYVSNTVVEIEGDLAGVNVDIIDSALDDLEGVYSDL